MRVVLVWLAEYAGLRKKESRTGIRLDGRMCICDLLAWWEILMSEDLLKKVVGAERLRLGV